MKHQIQFEFRNPLFLGKVCLFESDGLVTLYSEIDTHLSTARNSSLLMVFSHA